MCKVVLVLLLFVGVSVVYVDIGNDKVFFCMDVKMFEINSICMVDKISNNMNF